MNNKKLILILVVAACDSFLFASFYDCSKTFERNWNEGPFFPQEMICDLPGYRIPICSKVGISACPLMNARGIAKFAQLGYGVFVYKTIRSSAARAYDMPNVVYVDSATVDLGMLPVRARTTTTKIDTIANSIGNACDELEVNLAQIAHARAALHAGQILIVSIYGTDQYNARGQLIKTQEEDFAELALRAYKAGAHCIEANVSCPNVENGHCLYQDAACVERIIRAIKLSNPDLPVFAKVGVFASTNQLKNVLHAIARAGGQGVCGINSVPAEVVDEQGESVFGASRVISGLSGFAIQDLAYEFACSARKIISEDGLPLVLGVGGGIMTEAHIDRFLRAGADIVFSATSVMDYHSLAIAYSNFYEKKQQLAKRLHEIHAIKRGTFKLHSGKESAFYVDLRLVPSHNDVFGLMVHLLSQFTASYPIEVLCGVPLGGVPLASAVAFYSKTSLIMLRKEVKNYGMQRMIEGDYYSGQKCMIIDDVITSGDSLLHAIELLEKEGLQVTDIVVAVDRQEGGREKLEQKGYRVHPLFTIKELFAQA